MGDLAASVFISNKNNVWVNDNMVTHCHSCLKEFGLFRRKHHCRNCGNIFCADCAGKFTQIPNIDRPEPADYWNPSYYFEYLKGNKERVCNNCYITIEKQKTVFEDIVRYYDKSLEYMNQLPSSENNLRDYYCYTLRNIQYYLPDHEYSDADKKLLRTNAKYFTGHSKYLVHFIKSLPWSSASIITNFSLSNDISTGIDLSQISNTIQQNLSLVLNVLDGEKTYSCQDLYCTRTCNRVFAFDDCVNILYSLAYSLPDEILQYLFTIMSRTDPSVIQCHIPFFVNLIKQNDCNSYLQQLLYDLLSCNEKIRYHTFWFLTNAREKANNMEISNINSFMNLFDKTLLNEMTRIYLFFAGLINNLDDAAAYLHKNFHLCQPISLPYEPSHKLVAVDLDNISVKFSNSRPVEIPFLVNIENDNEIIQKQIRLLFKKESVINDVTVLNLMTLSNIILCDQLDPNFEAIAYPVMPLTSNSGVIEIIDDAKTIYDICNKGKILQYILSKNEDKVIADVLNRYMFSLVSYTLQSYFIGLGDRHLENIMLKNDGAIFHIDLGYIMGTDALPLSGCEIKLNSDMLDAICDHSNDRYSKYISLCSDGVILLKKYFCMFYILLSQTQDDNHNQSKIGDFIMSRFQPRQSDEIAVNELLSIIANSTNTYTSYVRDLLHYHTQERTIQNQMSRAVHRIYNLISG